MATGPSSVIITPPVFTYSSSTATTLTLDLTALPANANVVVFFYKRRGDTNWVATTERSATGTFTITGLSDDSIYTIMAMGQESAGEVGPPSDPLRIHIQSDSSNVFGLGDVSDTIVDRIQALTWPNSANKVFNPLSVTRVISESVVLAEISKLIKPACVVYDLGDGFAIVDEDPTFRNARLGLWVAVEAVGDSFGAKLLTGGHRGDATKSEGAGLDQIHTVLLRELKSLLRNDSSFPVRFIGIVQTGSATVDLDGARKIGVRTYTLNFNLREG